LSNLEDLEDKVFDDRIDASRDVAELRRDIAHQRRIIAPLRRVINALEVKAERFTKEDISAYFGDVSDHINRVWETLEECKESIEIYKDVDFTLTQDRTNRILMVLTILMTIMLPFTVVSGIYGMNIPLPFGSEPGSLAPFWALFSIMLLFAGTMLFFFRRRRWI
jgi:magnesium transporter